MPKRFKPVVIIQNIVCTITFYNNTRVNDNVTKLTQRRVVGYKKKHCVLRTNEL